jgi:hypothetical protein
MALGAGRVETSALFYLSRKQNLSRFYTFWGYFWGYVEKYAIKKRND